MNFNTLYNDQIKLVLLDPKYAQEIYNNNTGNIRDYFIPFDSIDEVNDWIAETEIKILNGDKLETIVFSKSGEFLGMIALDNLNDEIAEIRLWLKPEVQGKGIGKSGTDLLLNWYKVEFPSKQIRYSAEVKNIPSINLAKSLGFKFSKQFTDEEGCEIVEYLFG
jgi:RimJ/RimL family protein N-acetyltransferase